MTNHAKLANRAAWAGLVLALPLTYFVGANILKYVFGAGLLAAPLERLLAHPDTQQAFNQLSPWVFLGGGILAFILNIVPLARVSLAREGDEITVVISLTTRWWNLLIVGVSAAALMVMFAYLFVENFWPF